MEQQSSSTTNVLSLRIVANQGFSIFREEFHERQKLYDPTWDSTSQIAHEQCLSSWWELSPIAKRSYQSLVANENQDPTSTVQTSFSSLVSASSSSSLLQDVLRIANTSGSGVLPALRQSVRQNNVTHPSDVRVVDDRRGFEDPVNQNDVVSPLISTAPIHRNNARGGRTHRQVVTPYQVLSALCVNNDGDGVNNGEGQQ